MGLIGRLVETAVIVGALAVGGSVLALKGCSEETISYATRLPKDNVSQLKKSVDGLESALSYAGSAVKSAGESYQGVAEQGYDSAKQAAEQKRKEALEGLCDKIEKMY